MFKKVVTLTAITERTKIKSKNVFHLNYQNNFFLFILLKDTKII